MDGTCIPTYQYVKYQTASSQSEYLTNWSFDVFRSISLLEFSSMLSIIIKKKPTHKRHVLSVWHYVYGWRINEHIRKFIVFTTSYIMYEEIDREKSLRLIDVNIADSRVNPQNNRANKTKLPVINKHVTIWFLAKYVSYKYNKLDEPILLTKHWDILLEIEKKQYWWE